MRLAVVLCFVLVCFVSQGHGSFAEFMSNLPAEVGHAFHVAWVSITDAIKKPVKTRKSRSEKWRTLSSKIAMHAVTISSTTEEFRFHIEFKKHISHFATFSEPTTVQPSFRLRIPLISKPSSSYEWRKLPKQYHFMNALRTESYSSSPSKYMSESK